MNAIIPLEQVMNPVLIAWGLTAILLIVAMRFVKRPAAVLLLSVYRFFIQLSSSRV